MEQIPADTQRLPCTSATVVFQAMRKLLSPNYCDNISRCKELNNVFWTLGPDTAINGALGGEDRSSEAMKLEYTLDGRSCFHADYGLQSTGEYSCATWALRWKK